ncbi:MAG: exosortase-associated EpsI family protein [Gemmataceae bacterium]
MVRALPAIAAAVILVVSGIVSGVRTDRWGVSATRTAAAAKVGSVPAQLGDWTGTDFELDPWQLRISEADAHLARKYIRSMPSGREEVTVVLLSGRAAPLAVHTPDVCFQNSGFHIDGEPVVWRARSDASSVNEFWTATFGKPQESPVRVYWAWSDGGTWKAATDARLQFNSSPALYKLYVVCRPTRGAPPGPDAGQRFLLDAIPMMHSPLTQQ